MSPDFVKSFFCIHLDDHMTFSLQFFFLNVVYHTDWFKDLKKSSYPWDKSHLTMVYNVFSVLLNSDWWHFIEESTSMFISDVDL